MAMQSTHGMGMDERPYSCWLCTKAFRRKDNLDRHIKNTHNLSKDISKRLLANEAATIYLTSKAKGKIDTARIEKVNLLKK